MEQLMRIKALITILFLFAVSACVGGADEQSAAPKSKKEATDTQVVTATETSEAALEVTATTEDDLSEPTEEKTVEEKPTARVGLQGTDPETVSLASGEIQLVEFFAFW